MSEASGVVALCSPDGDVPAEGECHFDDSVGDNDCAAGTTCSAWGLGESPDQDPFDIDRRCRRFCTEDRDCDESMFCLGYAANCEGDKSCGATLSVGVCVSPCKPFTDDCGPGASCKSSAMDIDETSAFPICRSSGQGASGAPCAFQEHCSADVVCIQSSPGSSDGVCADGCDANHGCGEALTCTPLGNGVAVCLSNVD
jgi:hypothetical protein